MNSAFVQAPPAGESRKQLGALSLRANFIWTLAGNVVYAACQWGMLMALAKLGTPEMVGQFALGLAITAPVIIFANLALRAVQATDAKHDYDFGDYVALRLVTTFLAFVVIAGIVFVGKYNWQTAWVIMLIGLAKAFESVSDVYYGLFQQHERMNRIAISMIIKGCLSLGALVTGVGLTHGVLGGAIGLAITWALVLILYDVPSGALILNASSYLAALRPRWHLPILIKLTQLTLPLGFATMLISLNTNIPRYFIERYLGERELGFFAATAYLMVAGTTVVSALGQSASPRLASYYATGRTASFRTLLLKLLCVGVVLGAAGVLTVSIAGREILTLLYRKEYAVFGNVFFWLMVATTVSFFASFLGYGMTAAHYYKVQPFILAVSTALAALFCFVLVPGYGLLGAAWAIGLSSLTQMLASLICVIHAIYISSKLRALAIIRTGVE